MILLTLIFGLTIHGALYTANDYVNGIPLRKLDRIRFHKYNVNPFYTRVVKPTDTDPEGVLYNTINSDRLTYPEKRLLIINVLNDIKVEFSGYLKTLFANYYDYVIKEVVPSAGYYDFLLYDVVGSNDEDLLQRFESPMPSRYRGSSILCHAKTVPIALLLLDSMRKDKTQCCDILYEDKISMLTSWAKSPDREVHLVNFYKILGFDVTRFDHYKERSFLMHLALSPHKDIVAKAYELMADLPRSKRIELIQVKGKNGNNVFHIIDYILQTSSSEASQYLMKYKAFLEAELQPELNNAELRSCDKCSEKVLCYEPQCRPALCQPCLKIYSSNRSSEMANLKTRMDPYFWYIREANTEFNSNNLYETSKDGVKIFKFLQSK